MVSSSNNPSSAKNPNQSKQYSFNSIQLIKTKVKSKNKADNIRYNNSNVVKSVSNKNHVNNNSLPGTSKLKSNIVVNSTIKKKSNCPNKCITK